MMRSGRRQGRTVLLASTFMTILGLSACLLTGGSGCDAFSPPVLDNGDEDGSKYHNTTDPTNGGAGYLRSAACSACHPDYAALHRIHSHSQMLKKLSGWPPTYPAEGTRAGVPNPPDGKATTDLTFVIGGYFRRANFIDRQGHVMTNGVDGVNSQWNLEFPANGTVAGWTSFEPNQVDPKPYDVDCFKCHTTGPSDQGHQDGLPGIQGTFAETGVQCEACHGPGSNHVGTPPDPNKIYVNTAASACGRCHSGGSDPNVILAGGGFIQYHQQWPELLASPHAAFDCLECHDPHRSAAYDRDNAIVRECVDCHPNQNMAIHEGVVFFQGDHVEPVACQSCHMPYASTSGVVAPPEFAGPNGRIGDVRTHIWNINAANADFRAMFSADGGSVQKDSNGQASVTLDFVCMRCHTGKGRAFELTVRSASEIAAGIHELPQ